MPRASPLVRWSTHRLAVEVAQRTGIPQRTTELMVRELVEVIASLLVAGERVQLHRCCSLQMRPFNPRPELYGKGAARMHAKSSSLLRRRWKQARGFLPPPDVLDSP